MPKKKPIAKRLDKLFDEIKHEEPNAKPVKGRGSKNAAVDRAKPVVKPAPKHTRALETVRSITQTDSAMALAFQTGPNNWSTLQVLDETEKRQWSDEDQLLVKQVTDQLSLALENARLFQDAQRRAQEMTALADVGREISATLQIEVVLERIASYAKDLLGAESSAVYLPNPSGDLWNAVSAVGVDAEEIKNDPIRTGLGIIGNIAVTKKGRIVNDASTDGSAITVAGTQSGAYEHILAVPILTLDRLTGLMAVWRTGKGLDFSNTELDFLNNLAQQAAIAIENARLFQNVNASQNQLAEALRIGRMGYFEYNLQKGLLTLTNEMFSLVGSSAEKEGGNQFPLRDILRKYVIEEDIRPTLSTIADLIKNPHKQKLTQEIRFKTADGRRIWVETIFNMEKESEGGYSKIIGSSQDITARKTNELAQTAITHISESALTAKKPEELFKTVHDSIQSILPAKNFYVALYDRETNLISFPYHVDEFDEDWTPRKLGRGLTSHVIRSGRPLRTTPELLTELHASGEIVSEGSPSVNWLGVPLRSGGVITGVMVVQTYETSARITEEHVESFSVIAAQTAAALERLQAREALANSEADLRALFAAMEDVILVYDREGRYVRVAPTNPSRLFLPPDDMIGKKITEVLPSDLHAPFMEAIHQTLSTEQTTKIEYPLTLGDQKYWFDATLSKLSKDQVFWVARDVTQRKLADISLQRRNTYLAASSEIGRLVTSTLDIKTIFTRTVNLMNDRLGFYFASIYQIDEDGFHAVFREGTGDAGKSMKAQNHRVSVGSQTIVGRASGRGEIVITNDVQKEPYYQPNPLLLDTRSEVAIPLIVGGRVLGVLDIQSTDAQAFSTDDLSVLQSLADQVAVAINNATLFDESQELIKNLKEVDQLKSQFLANMSHELRTPLNSIIGFSRVILKGIDGPVTDMQNQDLTAIYNSGQHLLGLINDILDLARIEAGKMEINFEEVHISEMVHSVFSTAKGLVKEKPIQLIEKIPADMPTIRGDTMRVRQVLLNLMSNASKFTDEGTITVQSIVQKGPSGKLEALINVIDTGPGITPEGQEKLFKAFSQVDGSATRTSGGSGLGLSICANLVQLHGGRIGVLSEEGKGSTFWFTIPLYHQEFEDIPEGKKVVLAIDDDPQVISLYERYLNPQGYHVVPLTDPTRAKERIAELKPFAVTLDIMMPNIDGWMVLTDLKSDPATRGIPIIICSIVEQTDKGFNLGAADYLVKPILEEDIVNALVRLNKNGNIHEVLVIDDDPNDLRLIEKILNEHGQFKATLAEGGRKGWEAIITKAPDAIILDVFMPDMDGFTILEKLREDSSFRDIPVLVVSGGGLTNEQQKQLADYGQRLIAKGSLKEGDLIASIETALKRIGD
ncbi:MAG TPA: hypothetical protein DCX53_05200 [Anaerolineae bacterium]|nr:hypothetical protein [Anaerolineae bacterium]